MAEKAKARILVIDDDENIRENVSNMLEEEGYVVDTAETGKEAIEKSLANFYNLALIDIRLPDMMGVELLTKMREGTPKMVKIIVTGYPSQENAIKAVNKGAQRYIVKPFKANEFREIIKKELKKQQEELKYSQEKVAEFIGTRAEELEST